MMKKIRKNISRFLAVVFCFSLCLSVPVSADTRDDLLNYLRNWSYTESGATYTINVDGMTDDDLAAYIAADPLEWDAMIHEYLGLAFETLANKASPSSIIPLTDIVSPLALYSYTPSEVQYVDFKYAGSTYTREYLYTMRVNLTVSNGVITSLGTTNCTINCGANLSANNLTKDFAINNTSYASVGYSVEFIATIGYITVSTYDAFEHDFYV